MGDSIERVIMSDSIERVIEKKNYLINKF